MPEIDLARGAQNYFLGTRRYIMKITFIKGRREDGL